VAILSIVDILPHGTWSPAAPDAEERIAALEARIGHPLPADLRELHLHCRDVSLLERRYKFLAPEAMRSIAELQTGDASDDWAPRTWLAVIDLWDGNYVGVDLIPSAEGSHSWLDCDHEDVGRAAVIATSLAEIIREALSHPSGLYWLEPEYRPYGKLRYENPPSFWRKLHGEWYAALGDEGGPERCMSAGCDRLHIAHSVMCRRHHYRMIYNRPSPFDDD
jgi:hypothetical protein